MIVYEEREFRRFFLHRFRLVVGTSGHNNFVLLVVHQAELLRIKLKFYNGRPCVVGFTNVVFRFIHKHSARRSVFDANVHFACRTEHTHIHCVEFENPVIAAANGNFIYRRFHTGIGVVCHVVKVLPERKIEFVVFLVRFPDCNRTVYRRNRLIFVFNGRVVLIRAYLIRACVEQRCVRPVAVEGKVRNGQIHALAHIVKGNKPFNVHTVFEVSVQICFFSCAQRQREGDFYVCAAFKRHFSHGLAVNEEGLLGIFKHIRFFFYRDIVDRNAFRHCKSVKVVRLLLIGSILNVEVHRVDALLCRVVAKFNLRLGAIFHVQVRVRRNRLADVAKTCALLSNCVRQAVFIVNDGCRTHQELVDARCKRYARKTVVFRNVLTEQGNCACHVGRRHTRTAVLLVAADDCGSNFTAVRRDFGLNSQIVGRTPRREIGHERPCLEVFV